MGYETRLLIGVPSRLEEERGCKEVYFSIYATIDLCKLGNSSIHELATENQTPEDKLWFFYEGETKVTTDRYGVHMKPVPIAQVRAALEDDLAAHGYYRRLHWAIGLLKAMEENNAEDLQVLSFGY